jgi:hypothetical protein
MKQLANCVFHKTSYMLKCEVTEQEEKSDDLIVHTLHSDCGYADDKSDEMPGFVHDNWLA